jgi:hypothetical protein
LLVRIPIQSHGIATASDDPEGGKTDSHRTSLPQNTNTKARIIMSSRHVYRSRSIHIPWLFSRFLSLSLSLSLQWICNDNKTTHIRLSLLHLQLKIPILQDRSRLSRQQSAFWRLVLCLESIADRLHRHPLDAFEFVDVFDMTIQTQQSQHLHAFGSLSLLRRVRALTVLASLGREGGRRHLDAR